MRVKSTFTALTAWTREQAPSADDALQGALGWPHIAQAVSTGGHNTPLGCQALPPITPFTPLAQSPLGSSQHWERTQTSGLPSP